MSPTTDTSHTAAHGWYGPPNSRRFHYIGTDGRSLCGKWLVLAWNEVLIGRAYGPAEGDCATCTRKLATSQYVTQEVFDAIGEIGAPNGD